VTIDLLPVHIRDNYVVSERHHACAVLATDFPAEWSDLLDVLSSFRLRHSWVIAKGFGNKSAIARGINGAFASRGWQEKAFDVRVAVDGVTTLSPTHHVDYYKNRVAVETEWNNKDPFYDRDLTSFRLLHEYNVVSVGVIITRADELDALLRSVGKEGFGGANTTHFSMLEPRLANRVGGGCPVLAFGIKGSLYDAAS
jgi:hypothetical protein